MKTILKSAFYCLMILLIFSCETSPETADEKTVDLSGHIQKGPFINGSSISFYELKEDLSPTGLSYNTQILDNSGNYELNGVDFKSPYIELKADGFYYNEVKGEKSNAQLTLYALSDLNSTSSLNVNILSHLEKQRVEYLVKSGIEFSEAKTQAQSEVLQIFNIEVEEYVESELLDISKEGEANAKLLAVSVILQGYRTESELSELMANIIADIREDGTLDDANIGSSLLSHTKNINLSQIRSNLMARYEAIGDSVSIPDFEDYVTAFSDSNDYTYLSPNNYPESSAYGLNILYDGLDTLIADEPYSMTATIPEGSSLKIIIRNGMWYYSITSKENWTISKYSGEQTFEVSESGRLSNLNIFFDQAYRQGNLTIEFYENGSETPTNIKKITVVDQTIIEEPEENDSLVFPVTKDGLINILHENNSTFMVEENYIMAFSNLQQGDSLEIIINGGIWNVDPEGMPMDWYFIDYNESEKSQMFFFAEDMTFEIVNFAFLPDDYTEPVVIEYRTVINGKETKWQRMVDVQEDIAGK